MYDYDRIIKDKVPCYFWDSAQNKKLGLLNCVTDSDESTYRTFRREDGAYFANCEPIRTEDQLEYRLQSAIEKKEERFSTLSQRENNLLLQVVAKLRKHW